jgi:hypothetical protein
MSFLFVNDDDNLNKINIDDLYERKKQKDLKQISIFNKILNRIQKRIQLTARNKTTERYIWFNVPEYIFGEPVYDKGECIAYIVNKLESDKFHIRYVHPNTLFVSWENWVPSYVRNEFKKKTGIVLDEKGNVVAKEEKEEGTNNSKTINDPNKPGKKDYTPIGTYKPTGNLVYDQDLLEKIEKKLGEPRF